MPSETIYPDSAETKPAPEHAFTVGWSKMDHDMPGRVQVAAFDHSRQSFGGTNEDHEAGRIATSVSMSRDDINRAIRMLRRARDQAFGTDA